MDSECLKAALARSLNPVVRFHARSERLDAEPFGARGVICSITLSARSGSEPVERLRMSLSARASLICRASAVLLAVANGGDKRKQLSTSLTSVSDMFLYGTMVYY